MGVLAGWVGSGDMAIECKRLFLFCPVFMMEQSYISVLQSYHHSTDSTILIISAIISAFTSWKVIGVCEVVEEDV